MGIGSYTDKGQDNPCWLCQCLTWDGIACFCCCCGTHCCATSRTFIPACVQCLCFRCNCYCARQQTGCLGAGCLGSIAGCFGCVICPHQKLLISQARVVVKVDNQIKPNTSSIGFHQKK